jgi:hypothetical protein
MTSFSKQAAQRLVCCAGVCLILWTCPEIGNAGETPRPRVSLSWALDDAARSECIGVEALQQLVSERLKEDVFIGAGAGATRIMGQVSRAGEGAWLASFQVLGTGDALKGERRLRVAADRCRDLDPALSLVLALLIDPDLPVDAEAEPPAGEGDAAFDTVNTEATDGEPDATTGSGEGAAPPEKVETETAVPLRPVVHIRQGRELTTSKERRLLVAFGVGGEMQPALLMAPLPAPRLAARLGLRDMGAVEINVAYFTPQTQQMRGSDMDGEVTLSILEVGLDVRPRIFGRGIFVLDIITGCHIGALWFEGRGFSRDQKGANWLLDLPFGLGAALWFRSRFSLSLDLGAAVYVKREQTEVAMTDGGSRRVHEIPTATFFAVLSFLLRL